VRITSLDQEVPQQLSGTVFDVVSEGLGSLVGLLSEYHAVSNRLSHGCDMSDLMAELERIQHAIESSGGCICSRGWIRFFRVSALTLMLQ